MDKTVNTAHHTQEHKTKILDVELINVVMNNSLLLMVDAIIVLMVTIIMLVNTDVLRAKFLLLLHHIPWQEHTLQVMPIQHR